MMVKRKESWFNIIQKGKISLEKLVDDWIDEFHNDKGSAVTLILQFIIDSCGCDYKLVNHFNLQEIVDTMVNKLLNMEKYECPLMNVGLSKKKKIFKNYCELMQLIVKKCQNSIIYYQEFMPTILEFIHLLSKLQIRPLRFVGTLTGLKLGTGITSVFHNVGMNISVIKSQLQEKATNIVSDKVIERDDTLRRTLNELEENYEYLLNFSVYLMRTIFNSRFRDVSSSIRSLCCSELGLWIVKFPDLHLKDSQLKYLGWLLYDKCIEVRLSCVQAILTIYTEDNFSQLQNFTKKFKDRLIFMTLDKSITVSVVAFQILLQIDKFPQDIFNDQDIEKLFSLVFSKQESVAKIAGKFFLQRMGRMESSLLGNIICFLKDAKHFTHINYFVNVIWENCDLLHDWKLLSQTLLDSEMCNDVLAQLLLSCVLNITSNEYSHRIKNKKRSQIKDEANTSALHESLIEHLLEYLPKLYETLWDDADTLEILLRIPLLFTLNDSIITKNQVQFNCLLDKLIIIMSGCHDAQILENCGKVFQFFNTENNPAFNICNVKLNILANNLTENFLEAIERWSGINDEELTEDDMFQVETCVKKLVFLYCWFNISKWEMWHYLLDVLTRFIHTPSRRPQEVANLCIKGCLVGLLWDRFTLSSSEEEKKLSSNLYSFVKLLEEIMVQQETLPFQKLAFSSICDLAIAFSPAMSDVESLVFIPNKLVQNSLLTFLYSYIFMNETGENTICLTLQDKKLFLETFCKLLLRNIIPITRAAFVFQYYIKFEEDFGEIITALFSKVKEINCKQCALIVLKCLFMQFRNTSEEDGAALINLANKFASKFEANKNDTAAILELHKKGMSNALKQAAETNMYPHIGFCNILLEFVSKLRPSDVKVVLSSLEEIIPLELIEKNKQDFKPIVGYRKLLLQWSKSKTFNKGSTQKMKKPSKEDDGTQKMKKPSKEDDGTQKMKKPSKEDDGAVKIQSQTGKRKVKSIQKSSSAQKNEDLKRKRRRTVQSLDITSASAHQPIAISSPIFPLSGVPLIDDTSPM